MRLKNLFAFTSITGLLLGYGISARAQVFDFSTKDWFAFRASGFRQGRNSDLPAMGAPPLHRVWVWPGTADMPGEMVVDNSVLPPPGPDPNGSNFEVSGTWTYPNFNDRSSGAWPPSSASTNADKQGDYVYIPAQTSGVLANIGVSQLGQLPSFGTDAIGAALYKQVNDELNEVKNASLNYARWTFGSSYPVGTFQGTKDVTGVSLATGQRYALFVNFPNSGTYTGTDVHPNVDHVMVRVSWGSDVNDPKTSRIFMLNFGDTGGTWKRIRSGAGDDRFFPYDGINPLRVTVYAVTPDDVTNAGGFAPIVPADAVRLVPEALRGEIHSGSVSAKVPATVDPTLRTLQRTYFGRDETAGPVIVTSAADAVKYRRGTFSQTAYDPTKPVQNDPSKPLTFNPLVDEPSSSIRTAVFYCFEEDFANGKFGKLIWRYVTRPKPLTNTTVDDADPLPYFSVTNPGLPGSWNPISDVTHQPYGLTYWSVPVTDPLLGSESAVWQKNLPVTTTNINSESYSVFVWIPGGVDGSHFARHAKYLIDTVQGTITTELDQRNTNEDPGTPRIGQWRLLATGIKFPVSSLGGAADAPVAKVTLLSGSTDFTEDPSRTVVADAIQFVSEAQSSNSVVASPLIANIPFPNGSNRQMVFFGTTDGHMWALDALGVGGGSTLTTCYWVYPSISNPDPTGDVDADGSFTYPQDDPNYNPDPINNRPTFGIDGDLTTTTVGGKKVYHLINTAVDIGPWLSSPIYTLRRSGPAGSPIFRPLIVATNGNGRVYCFDPIGRTDAAGNPFPATFAAGDNPGIPGTTRRLMTWPTIARDKYLRDPGSSKPDPTRFKVFSDDPSKGYFKSSPVAHHNPTDLVPYDTSYVIVNGGDGHVYAVDVRIFNTGQRISNPNAGNLSRDGLPRWHFPADTTKLPAMTETGALSDDGERYVFSAGGRIYMTDTPNTNANDVANVIGVYPFAANPPAWGATGDSAPSDLEYTSPIVTTGLGVNAGKPVIIASNRDGSAVALDMSITAGANPKPFPVLWSSSTIGGARAPMSLLNFLKKQTAFSTTVDGPSAILPTDVGGLVGWNADTGLMMWQMFDGFVGAVPVIGWDGTLLPYPTSTTMRNGEAALANSFMYSGDEGNVNSGEINGQMRAYASVDTGGVGGVGMVTPGENQIQQGNSGVQIRLVDLWNAQRDDPTNMMDPTLLYEKFGDPDPMNAKSPYVERIANRQKSNTQGNVAVYEWGDNIYVAAWGTFYGSILPQVTFNLSSGSSTRTIMVSARPDVAYTGPAIKIDDGTGTIHDGTAWVAKAVFPLGRGNEADPQTPGRKYTLNAAAQLIAPGAFVAPTTRLAAGQFDPLTNSNPNDSPKDPNVIPAIRAIVIANPLALSTRGIPSSGAGALNTVGWTDGFPPTNTTTPLSEIITNGNKIASIDAMGNITETDVKDLLAPIGMVQHGATGVYRGINASGVAVPALLVADRSNLFKIGQALAGIRIGRSELGWGWNPTIGGFQAVTGNVFNPLPWEQFPNRIPNTSLDYPDIDRNRATVRSEGIDIGIRSVALDRPTVSGGIKTLRPTVIDLTLDVPRYQPANINRDYIGLKGDIFTGGSGGFVAPMNVVSGTLPTVGSSDWKYASPSGGYVGTYVVFVDSNNSGSYDGTQAIRFNTTSPAINGGREEVFRQMTVGVGVSPDMTLRTEETTIDMGRVPHGMGYSPTDPYVPSWIGPYSLGFSPWDAPNEAGFFIPLTIKNHGNVNMVNLRIARTSTDYVTDWRNPLWWLRLTSDQVEELTGGVIWSPRSNLLGGKAVGNYGVVSSLDHAVGNSALGASEGNLWPVVLPPASNLLDYDYLDNVPPIFNTPGGVYGGWSARTRVRPTLHKPRIGSGPQTMSLPDVGFGDPLGLLTNLTTINLPTIRRPVDLKPKVGVAVPMGTPVGTYTADVHVYEDNVPYQWREWQSLYNSVVLVGGDDDGVLNITTNAANPVIAETKSDPAFKLKAIVSEARLTNNRTAGSFNQVDVPRVDAVTGAPSPYGANVQPAAIRPRSSDPNKSKLMLVFPSNRPDGFGPNPNSPDVPWYLQISRLNPVFGTVAPYGPIFDWQYENGLTRWWDPLGATSQYPPAASSANIFPSQVSDVVSGNPPLVPGVLAPETVRHASASFGMDDNPSVTDPIVWLFWQGAAYKSASAGGAASRLDTRTFYVPTLNGAPNLATPLSFINDPNLPKFGPKPLIMTDLLGRTESFLFWFGGAQGRTRLFFNVHTGDLMDVTKWSDDTALVTPGGLQWVSDPNPIHRRVYSNYFTPAGEVLDAIDVAYTAVLANRKEAETLITRYAVLRDASGRVRLRPMPLHAVTNETLVRDALNGVWQSRDMAWVYRDPQTREYLVIDPADMRLKPMFQVFVYDRTGASRITYSDGTPAPINGYDPTTGQFTAPSLDTATGRLTFTSAMGGQLVVDPQLGTVAFVGIAPRTTDRVGLQYIPQSLRVNVSRNNSGVVTPPTGWAGDAAFAPLPHVPNSGANTGPVAFMDRALNPRTAAIIPGPTSGPAATVDRYWVLYRKSNTNTVSAASLYFKTMRLMARLPRGVVLNSSGNLSGMITVTGNRGPVEVDWIRGRLYFTELDEGNVISVTYNYSRDTSGKYLSVPATQYQVSWGDEMSIAVKPGDQPASEMALPTSSIVNEGQVTAFKDPYQDRVWVFWSSTRAGTTDLYYMTVSPALYPVPAVNPGP